QAMVGCSLSTSHDGVVTLFNLRTRHIQNFKQWRHREGAAVVTGNQLRGHVYETPEYATSKARRPRRSVAIFNRLRRF
ncbi:MAG: hypothetical protein ACRDL7_03090, partial [Gaiellaceae bacterium]